MVFLWWEKFLPGSDNELTKWPLVCSVSTRYTDIDENQTPSSHHGVCGGGVISHSNIMPPLIFLHGHRLNMEAYIMCLEEDWKVGNWKTLCLARGLCAMIQKNPVLAVFQKILLLCVSHGWGIAQPCFTKLCATNTKDELKARIMAAFTNLNKTSGKACRRFWNRLLAVVEAYGDFFE